MAEAQTLRIVIDDPGADRGSPRAPTPPAPQGRAPAFQPPIPPPVRASAPPPPLRSSDPAADILSDPGARKFGFTAEVLAKLDPKAVAEIAEKLAATRPPAPVSVPNTSPPLGLRDVASPPDPREAPDTGPPSIVDLVEPVNDLVAELGELRAEAERQNSTLDELTKRVAAALEAFDAGVQQRAKQAVGAGEGADARGVAERLRTGAPAESSTYGFADAKPKDDRVYAFAEEAAQRGARQGLFGKGGSVSSGADGTGLPRAMPVGKPPEPDAIAQTLAQLLPKAFQQGLAGLSSEAGKKAAAAGDTGGLLAAAGKAAGPIALVAVAANRLETTFTGFDQRVKAAGQAADQFAKNEAFGMFNTAAEAAASTLEEIPVVGGLLAAQQRAALAPLRAFVSTVDAFVQRGKELSGLSGQLAAANAQADVRRLTGDIREAKALGESLSKLTDSQSRAESDIREILLPIKEAVTKTLAEIAAMGADGLAVVKPFLKIATEFISFMIKHIDDLFPVLKLFKVALDQLKKIAANTDEKPADADTLIQDWLSAADGLGMNGFNPNPAGDAANRRRLNGPMFPGFAGFDGP